MDADQLRLPSISPDEATASPRIRNGVVLSEGEQRVLEALERQPNYSSIFKLAIEANCSYVWGYEIVHRFERLGIVALDRAGPWPKPIAIRRVK